MARVFLSFLSNYIGSLSISAVKIPKPHTRSLHWNSPCHVTQQLKQVTKSPVPAINHHLGVVSQVFVGSSCTVNPKDIQGPKTKKRDTNFIAVMVKMITNQGKFQGSKICDNPRSVLLFPLEWGKTREPTKGFPEIGID